MIASSGAGVALPYVFAAVTGAALRMLAVPNDAPLVVPADHVQGALAAIVLAFTVPFTHGGIFPGGRPMNVITENARNSSTVTTKHAMAPMASRRTHLSRYARGASGDYDNILYVWGSAQQIPWEENFFDKVLVMTEDDSLRNNRLSLLSLIVSSYSKLIDFSKLVVKS